MRVCLGPILGLGPLFPEFQVLASFIDDLSDTFPSHLMLLTAWAWAVEERCQRAFTGTPWINLVSPETSRLLPLLHPVWQAGLCSGPSHWHWHCSGHISARCFLLVCISLFRHVGKSFFFWWFYAIIIAGLWEVFIFKALEKEKQVISFPLRHLELEACLMSLKPLLK